MKRLIYQVYIGNRNNLYDHCTKSVQEYAKRIGADYKVLNYATLRIKPDVFTTNRNPNAWEKHGGYMPIFEKENVFDYFDEYDQCCVIDADIYIRPTAPSIFHEVPDGFTVGSIYECDLPITDRYANQIKNYSTKCWENYMQYDWNWQERTGGDFFNSGVMLYNTDKMKEALNGMSPEEFLKQPMLKPFIDGDGHLKWQSDQMTLNYWFKAKNIPVHRLEWKYNVLYSAVPDEYMYEGHFIHFFMKDKLPNSGENVAELMKYVNK